MHLVLVFREQKMMFRMQFTDVPEGRNDILTFARSPDTKVRIEAAMNDILPLVLLRQLAVQILPGDRPVF